MESSSPAQPGQKARLCSRSFPGPAKKRFTFKYHSYAVPSTKLRVILKAATAGEKVIWSTVGLEKNEWLSKNLTIDVHEFFSVRFRIARIQKEAPCLHKKDGIEIPVAFVSHSSYPFEIEISRRRNET